MLDKILEFLYSRRLSDIRNATYRKALEDGALENSKLLDNVLASLKEEYQIRFESWKKNYVEEHVVVLSNSYCEMIDTYPKHYKLPNEVIKQELLQSFFPEVDRHIKYTKDEEIDKQQIIHRAMLKIFK